MPELPEVEGVVRSLAPLSIGRTIQQVSISETVRKSKAIGKETILKGITTEDFMNGIVGMQIVDVARRSKYIYIQVEKESEPYLLVSHLGMTGAWFVVESIEDIREEKFRKHIHVIFTMSDGGLLVYADIRRFGELRLLRQEADYPPLLKMAPEPFDENALNHFLTMLTQPKYANRPIKELIMDGHLISGCGNIYATEALFRMNLHPARAASRIRLERQQQLFQTIVDVLQESIEAGGSSISDYRNTNGEAGAMQNRLQMYGRKHCPTCLKQTKTMQIAGRTSVYCPSCQR